MDVTPCQTYEHQGFVMLVMLVMCTSHSAASLGDIATGREQFAGLLRLTQFAIKLSQCVSCLALFCCVQLYALRKSRQLWMLACYS